MPLGHQKMEPQKGETRSGQIQRSIRFGHFDAQLRGETCHTVASQKGRTRRDSLGVSEKACPLLQKPTVLKLFFPEKTWASMANTDPFFSRGSTCRRSRGYLERVCPLEIALACLFQTPKGGFLWYPQNKPDRIQPNWDCRPTVLSLLLKVNHVWITWTPSQTNQIQKPH